MSESTRNTSEKIGRLVRNKFSEHNPKLPIRILKQEYLLPYAKIRLAEFARDVAKAKNKEQTVLFAAELLEVLAMVLKLEGIDLNSVHVECSRLHNAMGNYSDGVVVLEKTYEPDENESHYWVEYEEA